MCYKTREFNRFLNNEYTDLPAPIISELFNAGVIIDHSHYLHISKTNHAQIAFTENSLKGECDRQLKINFSKYLSRYTNLNSQNIGKFSAMLRAENNMENLHFAYSRDEIKNVYMNGVNSCMSHDVDSYATSGIHPTEVYANGVLSVCYVLNCDGDISARAICNETEKTYSRIYGDENYFIPILDNAGFSYDGNILDGQKLLLLKNDNDETICPYIDGHVSMASEQNGFLLITDDGEYDAQSNTNGLLLAGILCDDCEERTHEDDVQYIESNNRHVCNCCLGNNYFYAYTGQFEEYVHVDNEVYEYEYSMYTTEGMEYHGLILLHDDTVANEDDAVICEDTGDYMLIDETISAETKNGDTVYFSDCDEVVEDIETGESIILNDANTFELPDGNTVYSYAEMITVELLPV